MDSPAPKILLTRKAPAKLNFGLRVTARRDDGFHEIDTLMVPLRGLADVLTFAESDALRFTCDDPNLPANNDNLVVRAANAFSQATGIACNFDIHLQKHIPSGAGLGGGSSDAAATLRALQQIHSNLLDDESLRKIAASIGSDVPFFLQDAPARCTGRGEIVTPMPDLIPAPLPVLLLKPAFPVLTADAYRHVLDPTLASVPGLPDAGRIPALDSRAGIGHPDREPGDIGIDPSGNFLGQIDLINDLERPVFAKHRFLSELAIWLHQRPGILVVHMSGSGSTLFAILAPGTDPAPIVRAATHELDPTLWHWHGLAG